MSSRTKPPSCGTSLDNNSGRRSRTSIRCEWRDYSRPGVYFITVLTRGRRRLFGRVKDGIMILNERGRIVAEEWTHSAEIRKEIQLDEWVIMPDHFHAIVWIDREIVHPASSDDSLDLPSTMRYDHGPTSLAADNVTREPPQGPESGSLGSLVGGFKAAVTTRIRRELGGTRMPIWHRNYWDSIIHNEESLDRIRHYIRNNPAAWERSHARH